MMEINDELLRTLFAEAEVSERRRMNYDLRTSAADGSQRMLNALLPGTEIPVHRHPKSNENVFLLVGRMDEVIYEETGERGLREKVRFHLCPAEGRYGCVVPAGAWHSVEVLEPSVIYEAKDGKYGEDGSERW